MRTMKRLYLMIMLFAGCITMNAQGINGLDKQTRKYLETAEKYIDDFHCDSVVKAYSVSTYSERMNTRTRSLTRFRRLQSWNRL